MSIALAHSSRSIIGVALFSFTTAVASHAALVPNQVEGSVKTADGRPVSGATIRIAGATGAGRGTTINATTDANGNYRVKVPLGHYNVDGFASIEFEGQTYKELWLDRGDAPCGRVMSDKGIVRNFVLRLSGPKRCFNGVDPNNPYAYNGAYITAMTSAFPDDAVITFSLTPLGRLADGTTGRPLKFTRTGAALQKGGGQITQTSFLHDIPLGRYNIVAEVRYADGRNEGTTLELRDGGNTSGSTLAIVFNANVFGGGIRPLGLGVSPGGAIQAADAQNPELPTVTDPVIEGDGAPDPNPAPEAMPVTEGPQPLPAPAASGGLPVGRYVCSYRSQYAGDIPTGKSITIRTGGRYAAYDGTGTYTRDTNTENLEWTGPLGDGDVRATFEKHNGQPAIKVVGGPASGDPDKTNFCVLTGS